MRCHYLNLHEQEKMRRQANIIKWSLLALLLSHTTNAFSGTAGLSGQYRGDFQFNAYAHVDGNPNANPANGDPVLMGWAIERIKWDWDFDSGVANFRFDLGVLYDIDTEFCLPASMTCNYGFVHGYMLTIAVPITVHAPVTFTDNGDGTYTGLIDFQVYNNVFSFPGNVLVITWEITKDGNALQMITADADGNGAAGTILGDAVSDPPWGGFPFPFEPTWDGVARLAGADSNGDGLHDEFAIALGLEPDLVGADTDTDGVDDATELGAHFSTPLDLDQDGILDAVDDVFNNPVDSDNDGVIDALEPGVDALDTSRANGLRFTGTNFARNDVNVYLNLAIDGQSLAHKTGSGDDFQGPPGLHYAFDKNTRASDVGPVLSFKTSVNIGGSVTARLNFSSPDTNVARMPEKLLLYFVDLSSYAPGLDNKGENFHLQAKNTWTRIDDNTIDIILTDGGTMDEDGLENGSISTSLALARNSKGDFNKNSGNAASLSLWSTLLLFANLLLFRLFNLEKSVREWYQFGK